MGLCYSRNRKLAHSASRLAFCLSFPAWHGSLPRAPVLSAATTVSSSIHPGPCSWWGWGPGLSCGRACPRCAGQGVPPTLRQLWAQQCPPVHLSDGYMELPMSWRQDALTWSASCFVFSNSLEGTGESWVRRQGICTTPSSGDTGGTYASFRLSMLSCHAASRPPPVFI